MLQMEQKKIREQNLSQDEKKVREQTLGQKEKNVLGFFSDFMSIFDLFVTLHGIVWPLMLFTYCFKNYCQPNKILTFNQFPIHFSAKRKCLVVVLIRKTLVILYGLFL